jgi:chromate transporter
VKLATMNHRPGLISVLSVYLRIANTTFGGGDPTMAALYREMVERRKWITAEQYGLCYSLARLTPGTNVLAFSAGAAWLVRGWIGAVLAVAGASIPSAVLAVWLVHAYEAWSGSAVVQAVVAGMVAAVVGMMVAGAVLLFRSAVAAAGLMRGALLSVGSGLLSGVFQVEPVLVLAIAAAAGFLWPEPRRS